MTMNKKEHYKTTLHLPQTSFPMKGQLPKSEPGIIEKWEVQQIHKKILEKRRGSKGFFLPDGPPYANGPVHMGHVLNKILKDMVIKYKNLKGFKAPFWPSWDCHGLPIELKALKKLRKTATTREFRQLCREEALFWVENQKHSFKRLGVLADWDRPLLTMDPLYCAEELRVFAKMVRKGFIYRGTKPVFWCFKLRTAMAFSEAEYREHKSPSVYVNFYLNPEGRKKLNFKKPIGAVIWTTTPWTLPANAAVCLHPDFEYGLYEGDRQFYLVASERARHFFKETGLLFLKKQNSFKGRDLEGLISLHPFLNRLSPLILGDHVSLESGTGLVHTAPGHGLEDHLVGKKYHLKEYCPVDEKGCFTDDLPEDLSGLFIFKGNQVIIEKMRASGHLIKEKELLHSYPYSPRSDSPLIYRSTSQWFVSLNKPIGMSSLKAKALKACEKEIQFIPLWGGNRLSSMVKASPDWCLSRQRVWGVPLLVFYCKDCGQALLDPKIIENIANHMEKTKEGIEYYFSKSTEELLPPKIECKSCGGRVFEKGNDILDVWFDSGVQHFVLSYMDKNWSGRDNLFLEGSDQHRGWFQTSLLSSLALNSDSPFQTLLTHGFVNDKQGRKMSKSKGNVLDPEKIIKSRGAEILRLWVCSENYSFDINAGEENFERVTESYRRFRNTFRFILGNLKGFNPEESLPFDQLSPIDQWILIQLNLLIKNTTKSFDQFAFYKVYQYLNHFFTVDLSAFYLDIIKDRLYTFSKQGPERRKAQSTLYQLIEKLLPLMAPVTSFLSEEAYSYLPREVKESIFLEDFPEPSSTWKSKDIENLFAKMFPIRVELNKQIEDLRKKGQMGSNLQAGMRLTLERDFITPALKEREQLEFFGISQIFIQTGEKRDVQAFLAEGSKCLRCWFVSKNLNIEGLCPKCINNLVEK